jgi:hypothetical protein
MHETRYFLESTVFWLVTLCISKKSPTFRRNFRLFLADFLHDVLFDHEDGG